MKSHFFNVLRSEAFISGMELPLIFFTLLEGCFYSSNERKKAERRVDKVKGCSTNAIKAFGVQHIEEGVLLF